MHYNTKKNSGNIRKMHQCNVKFIKLSEIKRKFYLQSTSRTNSLKSNSLLRVSDILHVSVQSNDYDAAMT